MFAIAFTVLSSIAPSFDQPSMQQPLDAPPALLIRSADGRIGALVTGPDTFTGYVIVSLRSDLIHSFVGLPPLLADSMLLGSGKAEDGSMSLNVPLKFHPKVPLLVYAQAVIVVGEEIQSSDVQSFDIDS